MRSKASYFSLSIPLIKENMRRFWAVPVLAFLVYFLSGVFPILMSYKNLKYMASYIESSLHNMQPFFMGAHLLVPVITAVLLYRYLQSVSSVAVMHSMPFTRSKLYNSNLVSGLILISAPIILNGVILLLLSKPTFREWGYENTTVSTVNVFAGGEVLNWMGTSLLIIIVLFSVAVFAAIVTGNNLMHLLTSYFFIFLIPVLYSLFNVYFQEFLYGFDMAGNWMDIALSISPYTAIINGGGYFKTTEVLFYLATILVMLVISAFLYNKRRLERATDSLTFGFMKPIICYIVAFLGMTMLGFYFQVLGEGRLYMYAGFAAGTLIFFIIGQMIVVKSPRIYNKEGLRSFLIYAVIAVLFIVGLNVDATGFERRVPDPQKLEGAYVNGPLGFGDWGNRMSDGQLTTPENLEALAALHHKILDNRARFEGDQYNSYTSSLQIRYNTKGLFDMSRRYSIDYLFWAESPELKKIFESAEYKARYSFYGENVDEYVRAYFYSDMYSEKDREIVNTRLLKELLANLEKDFAEMSYEEYISPKPSYANIELQYTTKDGKGNYGDERSYMNFSLPRGADNTINWLKAKGYDFELTADMVEWIDIYAPLNDERNKEMPSAEIATRSYDNMYKYGERAAWKQITDKAEIEKILQSYDSFAIDYDTAYEISIAYRPNQSGRPVTEKGGFEDYQYISGYLNGKLDFM
ncbi:hypothetical protein MASR2M70_04900 [Bacillota bacterium]